MTTATASTTRTRRFLGAFLGLVLLPAAAPALVSEQARPAAQILRDFDGVAYPSFSDGSDPESIARFTQAIEAAAAKQEELALELRRAHPGHARVAEVMTRRWTLLCTVSHAGARVLEETTPCLAPTTAPALRKAAAAVRGRAALESDLPPDDQRRILEEAWAAAPGDEGAAAAIFDFARHHTADPAAQRALLGLFDGAPNADAANSEWIAGDVKSLRRLLDRVGKELEVELAAASPPTSMRALKGRPFLLHLASPPGSEKHESDAATLRRFQERFAAADLQLVTVQEEFGSPDQGLLSGTFGQNEVPLLLLVDRDGRLAAFCFRVEPIERELERLLAAPPKRRAI